MINIPYFEEVELRPKSSDSVLIIPVLNEGCRIQNQLIKIFEQKIQLDIMLADGDSIDNSLSDLDFLRAVGVNTLLIKKAAGKLSAQLRMAFWYGLQKNYKNFITMDGNNKDGVLGIYSILEALNEGYDFVQGSRYLKSGNAMNTPLHRDLAIRLIHAPITSMAAGKKFTDTTNGFRGYNYKILQSSKLSIFREEFDTYELPFYLPIRASRMGFKCIEVPVERHYPKQRSIPTKITGLKMHLNLMKILVRACFGLYNPKE